MYICKYIQYTGENTSTGTNPTLLFRPCFCDQNNSYTVTVSQLQENSNGNHCRGTTKATYNDSW